MRKSVSLGKGFYFFGETGLNFQDYSNTYIYSSLKGELKGQNISIAPGISYAVSRSFHLEVGLPQLVALGYPRTKQLVNDAITQKTNGVNFNVAASSFSTFSFGIQGFLAQIKVAIQSLNLIGRSELNLTFCHWSEHENLF